MPPVEPDWGGDRSANAAIEQVRRSAERTLGLRVVNTRVRELTFTDADVTQTVRIGDSWRSDHEPVVAILETPHHYLICTPSRGVRANAPIIIGKADVVSVG